MSNVVDIESVFPIMGVQDNAIISKMGDYTIGFKVTLPEIFTLDNSEYEAFHQAWIKAMKNLPKHTVFHKQDWFVKETYKAKFDKDHSNEHTGFDAPQNQKLGQDFLSRSSERFFNERPYLYHTCYIYITKKPAYRKISSSVFSTLTRKNIVPQDVLDKGVQSEFFDSIGQFKRILEDTGFIKMEQLTTDEILSKNEKAGTLERYLYLMRENEVPTIKQVQVKPDLRIGDDYCTIYTLGDANNLPPACGSRLTYDKLSTDRTRFSIGFASAIGLLLPCNHIYNQFIFIDDAEVTLRNMERKQLRLNSLSGKSRQNGIARDAVNSFLNEARSTQRLPVKAHFNLMVWTNNVEEQKDLNNMVSSAIASMDATPKRETWCPGAIYWGGLPGNEGDFPANDTFDIFLDQSTTFLNLETNYQTSIPGVGIRMVDRISGMPVDVDISDEPMIKGIVTNRNKFIVGPSGSGKSFFTNHMMRSYYEQGAHCVLVDVGHSYKGLCDLVGGYYFTYTEENPIKFNPFYIGEGDSLDTEKLETIKTLLFVLWKKDDEKSSRSEYVALSNALQIYFEKIDNDKSIFPCFDTFYEFLKNEYKPYLLKENVKESNFDIDTFLYVLQPYYKGGEFDYLLNAKEDLNLLAQPFIVFELDNIKDHAILFPVVTMIIMEVFISKMRKLKGIRKIILIEEAWKAIAKAGFAEYIKYLFKTVRKFFGEAIVVTQEVEDIISSEIVKEAIINNSDCKILLDQAKYKNKFGDIQRLLGLNDKHASIVLSLNKNNDPKRKYKEVAIILGDYAKAYGTEVSLEEYLTYTTEQTEKVKLWQYQKRWGGDLKKAISEMASDMRNGTLK
ncbi:conjugation system TraG family ATPase [Pedobacter sp. CG_S7]|uniref:TraG family conjugative transposon ATPase n=1 Tax=Pedobacter sp. CG_S7 TaxID=3143930 RepID=UPI003397EF87